MKSLEKIAKGLDKVYAPWCNLFGQPTFTETLQSSGLVSDSQTETNQLSELIPINATGIVLKKNELCYYQGKIEVYKVKNVVVGSESAYVGTSARSHGFGIHSGKSAKQVVRGNMLEQTAGMFYITDNRLVLVSVKDSFDKTFEQLSSYMVDGKTINLAFGSSNYIIATKNKVEIDKLQRVLVSAIANYQNKQ